MNEMLIRKLLLAIAGLTAIYLTFINILYQDLTRRISRSVRQLLPGIALFIAGIVLSRFLKNPDTVFSYLVTIKSGTAKSIIAANLLPIIAESIYAIGIITGLTAIIDKLLYFWRKRRVPFLASLGIIIITTAIAAATLLAIITGGKGVIVSRLGQLQIINLVTINVLGITALLLAILNVVKIIQSKKA